MARNSTSLPASSTHIGIQGILLYPIDPYIAIGFVLLLVGVFQWAAFFHARLNSRPRSVQRDEETLASRHKTSIFRIPLALVNFYRVFAFRVTVGFGSYVFNLAEALVMVGYVALLLVWTFVVSYDPDSEPLNWCSRAGLLAASQFPFITILGTKDNIISLITRISADKLNFVHRLTARACLVLIAIHAFGGGNNFWFFAPASNTSETFGIVAALVFAGLVAISIRPIRERAYELFFYFHFVAVIVIMLATIMHIKNYSGWSFTYYIWPSFIIWIVYRLARTCRLLYFNFSCFGTSQKASALDASTELLLDDLVRVRCRRPNNFHWSPGQHAYLIMPSVSRLPFEAHPFSIASVESALFAPDPKVTEDSSYGKELVFLIGVKSGFTRRLKDVAARGERVKVYVDGPYGGSVNLGCYNTALFIAGGTGITFALPALLNTVESARNSTSCCRRVVLVWSIRDAEFLNHVSEALAKAVRFAPPGLKVDIQVFVTKSGRGPSMTAPENRANFASTFTNPFWDQNPFSNSLDSFEKPEDATQTATWLKVTNGRPKLERMIEEEMSAANGRVSVSVCGPIGMTKVVRKALRLPWSGSSSPLNGGPSVTLHVESFGYA